MKRINVGSRIVALLGLLLATTSNVAANQICTSAAADQDGDGWGWENNASCVVTSTTSNPSDTSHNTNATATPASAVVCNSSSADPDGDGWGWENNRSCFIVANTTPSGTATPEAAAPATTSVSNSSGQTVCNSPDADPDGDGWGWENNGSCVVLQTNSDNTASTPPANLPAANTFNGQRVCSSSVADPDGDGWGWENNSSCIIANNTIGRPQQLTDAKACSLPSYDDNNDGFGFENNQTCVVQTPVRARIMAVGDSITHGTRRESAASYRKPFTELLTANSCDFQMTGSQSGNNTHNTFVSPHEGYSGHRAEHTLNGFNNSVGNNEGISITVERYQPHVILLHIGSNDMRAGQDSNQTVGEIDQIISIALAADSAPVVLVANVIPWYQDPVTEARVETLGDQIEAYVTQLNDPRVILVDVRSGYQPSMMVFDQIHPSPVGEQHIANQFFTAYDSAGFCR